MNPRNHDSKKAADDNEFGGPLYGGQGRDPDEGGEIAEDAPPARDSEGYGEPMFGGHGLDEVEAPEAIEDEPEAKEERLRGEVKGPGSPHFGS
jgi:hypothetical protein